MIIAKPAKVRSLFGSASLYMYFEKIKRKDITPALIIVELPPVKMQNTKIANAPAVKVKLLENFLSKLIITIATIVTL